MNLVFSVILFDKQQLHYYQWHFNERMQTTNEKYPQKEIVNLSLQQEKTLYVQKKSYKCLKVFFDQWSNKRKRMANKKICPSSMIKKNIINVICVQVEGHFCMHPFIIKCIIGVCVYVCDKPNDKT